MAQQMDYYSFLGRQGQTKRKQSEMALESAVTEAQRNIKKQKKQEALEARKKLQATPVTPSAQQLETLQAGGVRMPSIFESAQPSEGLTTPQSRPAGVGAPVVAQPSVAQPMPDATAQMGTGGVDSATGEPMRQMTPEEVARQEEIRKKIDYNIATGGERYTPEEKRRIDQENKIAEAKAGIGSRAIIDSLAKEGMTRDEQKIAIEKELGIPASQMSRNQALDALKRVQRSRQKSREAGAIDAGIRDKITNSAAFDTDESGNRVPQNTEAEAQLYIDELDKLGPDGETSVYDSMTTSQKNQADRMLKSMSRGTKDANAERRFNNMLSTVQGKIQRNYQAKQAKEARLVVEGAKRKAKQAEQKEWLRGVQNEFKSLDDVIQRYFKETSDDARNEMMSPEQFKEMQNRHGELLGIQRDFNNSGVMPTVQGQAQPQTEEMVKMRSPDGEIASVPKSSAQKYLDRGAIIVE